MVPDNFMNFKEHNTHEPGVTARDSTRKFYHCYPFSKFCTLYSLFYPLSLLGTSSLTRWITLFLQQAALHY